MSKQAAQHSHASKRMYGRLGIRLTEKRHREIVSLIQSGKAKLERRQSNRVRRYEIEIDGENCIVVYDRQRKQVVTVWKAD